jgi:HEAT repeat protein
MTRVAYSFIVIAAVFGCVFPARLRAADLPADVAAEVAKFKDADPKVRQKGLTALGKMGEKAKPAIPNIIEMLNDKTTWVTTRAMMVLAEIGPDESCAKPVAPFLAREPDIRSPAVDVFVAMKDKGVPTLIAALKDDKSIEGASAALEQLGKDGKAAAAALADVAKTAKSRPAREAAAKALKAVNK